MAWENLAGIATRVHLKLFGQDAKVTFTDGRELLTKVILSPHMTHLKDHHSDFESFALIASLAKEIVLDPQTVLSIFTQEKEYKIVKYKLEPDGFYNFFLSE